MLYHYTSLSTLALILQNQSIKFNRLDLMDDPDESLFGYGDSNMKFNSFSFASCWTADPLENIALWKMYADFKGVRIGLNEDMFITYNDSFLEDKFYREGNLRVLSSMNSAKPQIVKYDLIDDTHAIEFYQGCVTPKGKDVLLKTNEIAIHKKKYWKFQNEVRFVIRGMSTNEKGRIIDEAIERTEFYIPLKSEHLKRMEVLLGPQTGDGERAIVDALLFKAFSDENNAKVEKSVVKIR